MYQCCFYPIQPKSIEALCSNITKLSTPRLQEEVNNVVTKFTHALSLFSKCHNGYNSSVYMGDEDIKQLGKNDIYTL